MNTQTVTIQEFSRMMTSNEKSVLPEFIREIIKIARPEDVRLLESKASIKPQYGWAWW